jgi:aldehyde dehydrogenase (NAD+)
MSASRQGSTGKVQKYDTRAELNSANEFSKPLLIHPVIFTGVAETQRIVKEEISASVVIISSFAIEEEAIAKANDTEFGLCAALYVWERN